MCVSCGAGLQTAAMQANYRRGWARWTRQVSCIPQGNLVAVWLSGKLTGPQSLSFGFRSQVAFWPVRWTLGLLLLASFRLRLWAARFFGYFVDCFRLLTWRAQRLAWWALQLSRLQSAQQNSGERARLLRCCTTPVQQRSASFLCLLGSPR